MSSPGFDIVNKKARYEFHLLDSYVAGIQLLGSEIKALRQGKCSLKEAYCVFRQDELWIKNMHIAEYTQANQFNHEPMRVRRLLLRKRELKKLQAKVKERGLTIVPVRIFESERGQAKVEVALAKGKKVYDKRQSIKDRDSKRDYDRDYKTR